MSATKVLNGQCQHCGGHIEFPADAAGASAECPHCHQTTELFLSAGETEGADTRTGTKTVIFILLACVILLGGLGGAIIALKRAKRMAAGRTPTHATATNAVVNPFADKNFSATDVVLQKAPGSSLIHATGSVKNLSSDRRFAVRVEIELKDADGQLLDPAKDYVATIEPGAVWNFKAMVNAKTAQTARVSAITEDK